MERESNPMQALCRSGCGFYGSPATDGLCSLCYKEALKKKQQPPVSAPSPASSVSNAQSLSSLMETATAQPTVPCLPSPTSTSPASTDSSNLNSHIPIDKSCDNQQTNESGPDAASDRTNGSRQLVPVSEDPETSSTTAEDVQNIGRPGGSTDQEIGDESTCKVKLMQKTIDEGASPTTSLEAGASSADNSDKDGDKDAKKKKNRCATCRKKVGLTGFECRCGGLFCAVHRYSDKHDCSFNYREMGAQEIRRNNPVVVGEKIQKI